MLIQNPKSQIFCIGIMCASVFMPFRNLLCINFKWIAMPKAQPNNCHCPNPPHRLPNQCKREMEKESEREGGSWRCDRLESVSAKFCVFLSDFLLCWQSKQLTPPAPPAPPLASQASGSCFHLPSANLSPLLDSCRQRCWPGKANATFFQLLAVCTLLQLCKNVKWNFMCSSSGWRLFSLCSAAAPA